MSTPPPSHSTPQPIPNPQIASSAGVSRLSAEQDVRNESPSSSSPSSPPDERGRPTMQRPKSGSIIIPRGTSADHQDEGIYSPNDARAMSPRRSEDETEELAEQTRLVVREQARLLQKSLAEIADSIAMVKADHERLERQNLALQDYIGGLTRSMQKNAAVGPVGGSSTKARK